MNTQLDSLGKMFEALPAACIARLWPRRLNRRRASSRRNVRESREFRGVGDMLKSILDRIFEKLSALLRQ